MKCVLLSINYIGNYCNINKFVYDINYYLVYVIYIRIGFFFGFYYGEIYV